MSGIKEQLRSVIQWEHPEEWELFRKYSGLGDEIKNASKLILLPGQGCLFMYEGSFQHVWKDPGIYDIQTDNRPFFTTLRKFLQGFVSEHKTHFWFFRTADILNIRWGTRMPITYSDPLYKFPVQLRAYGNYSLRIQDSQMFFSRVIAGQEWYTDEDLQVLFLSRISQSISNYLANARFSYAEIDARLNEIAQNAAERTVGDFRAMGFELLDFRIEGTSFDDETRQRIAGISDIHADVQAAELAGVSFAQLQQLKALREAATNQSGSGFAVYQSMQSQPASFQPDVKADLQKLKNLLDEGLINEEEYSQKKQEILKRL